MKTFIRILTKIYFYILHLYPASYRKAFQEEILLDFKDMLTDASKEGIFSLIAFCLREARDIPLSLASTHLEESRMMSIFRSQPLTNGLRGALGFGVAFAIANIIGSVVWSLLGGADNSIIRALLNGLVMGILFAVLFGNRSTYSKYILVGTLGWFLQDTMRGIWPYSFNLPVFLSTHEYTYFSDMTLILSGAFLGLIFIVVRSERPESIRLLIAYAFAYPLFAYFYVKQVSNFLVFSTPWRFIALAILMVVLICGVFFIAIESSVERKFLWVIVAGAIGRLLMVYLIYFLGRFIYEPSSVWDTTGTLSITVSNAVYGIFFGLLIGLVLGFQTKNASTQMVASI
jgi:hypothetical protein